MHNDGFCHSFSIFPSFRFQKISEKAYSGRSVSVDGVHAWYIKSVWMMLESPFLELGQTELVSLHYTSDSDYASGECSEPDPLYQEQQHLQSQPWHTVTTVIFMVPFVCPSGPREFFLFHLRFAHILTFWNSYTVSCLKKLDLEIEQQVLQDIPNGTPRTCNEQASSFLCAFISALCQLQPSLFFTIPNWHNIFFPPSILTLVQTSHKATFLCLYSIQYWG